MLSQAERLQALETPSPALNMGGRGGQASGGTEIVEVEGRVEALLDEPVDAEEEGGEWALQAVGWEGCGRCGQVGLWLCLPP